MSSDIARLTPTEFTDTIARLNQMKVAEIKDILRSLDFKLTGRRHEVIARIEDYFKHGMELQDTVRLLAVRVLILMRGEGRQLPIYKDLYRKISKGEFVPGQMNNFASMMSGTGRNGTRQNGNGNVSNALNPNASCSHSNHVGSESSHNKYGVNESSPYRRHALYFADNPFYKLRRLIHGSPQPCYPQSGRGTCDIAFSLSDNETSLLALDSTMKAYVLCGVQANSSPASTDVAVHFPQPCELHVNGSQVQHFRGIKNKIGTSKPADITNHLRARPALNKIQFVYTRTTETFLLYVYIVQTVSISEILQGILSRPMIHKNSTREKIRAQNDDDDIVVSDVSVTLRDPVSYTRMKYPVQSVYCDHTQCFDALIFLQSQVQIPMWSCPYCQRNVKVSDLAISEYFMDILKTVSVDVEQVLIHSDGSWSLESSVTPATRQNTPAKSPSSSPSVLTKIEDNPSSSIPPDVEIVLLDSESESESEIPLSNIQRRHHPRAISRDQSSSPIQRFDSPQNSETPPPPVLVNHPEPMLQVQPVSMAINDISDINNSGSHIRTVPTISDVPVPGTIAVGSIVTPAPTQVPQEPTLAALPPPPPPPPPTSQLLITNASNYMAIQPPSHSISSTLRSAPSELPPVPSPLQPLQPSRAYPQSKIHFTSHSQSDSPAISNDLVNPATFKDKEVSDYAFSSTVPSTSDESHMEIESGQPISSIQAPTNSTLQEPLHTSNSSTTQLYTEDSPHTSQMNPVRRTSVPRPKPTPNIFITSHSRLNNRPIYRPKPITGKKSIQEPNIDVDNNSQIPATRNPATSSRREIISNSQKRITDNSTSEISSEKIITGMSASSSGKPSGKLISESSSEKSHSQEERPAPPPPSPPPPPVNENSTDNSNQSHHTHSTENSRTQKLPEIDSHCQNNGSGPQHNHAVEMSIPKEVPFDRPQTVEKRPVNTKKSEESSSTINPRVGSAHITTESLKNQHRPEDQNANTISDSASVTASTSSTVQKAGETNGTRKQSSSLDSNNSGQKEVVSNNSTSSAMNLSDNFFDDQHGDEVEYSSKNQNAFQSAIISGPVEDTPRPTDDVLMDTNPPINGAGVIKEAAQQSKTTCPLSAMEVNNDNGMIKSNSRVDSIQNNLSNTSDSDCEASSPSRLRQLVGKMVEIEQELQDISNVRNQRFGDNRENTVSYDDYLQHSTNAILQLKDLMTQSVQQSSIQTHQLTALQDQQLEEKGNLEMNIAACVRDSPEKGSRISYPDVFRKTLEDQEKNRSQRKRHEFEVQRQALVERHRQQLETLQEIQQQEKDILSEQIRRLVEEVEQSHKLSMCNVFSHVLNLPEFQQLKAHVNNMAPFATGPALNTNYCGVSSELGMRSISFANLAPEQESNSMIIPNSSHGCSVSRSSEIGREQQLQQSSKYIHPTLSRTVASSRSPTQSTQISQGEPSKPSLQKYGSMPTVQYSKSVFDRVADRNSSASESPALKKQRITGLLGIELYQDAISSNVTVTDPVSPINGKIGHMSINSPVSTSHLPIGTGSFTDVESPRETENKRGSVIENVFRYENTEFKKSTSAPAASDVDSVTRMEVISLLSDSEEE